MKFLLFCLFFSLVSFSQSLNYDYSVTFGNHVIAINEINYDFQEGDLIGCFFINQNGQLQCCGSTVYNNEEVVYVSAWPDDFLTENQEGFYEGDVVSIESNNTISINYEKESINFERLINYLNEKNLKILDISIDEGDLEDVFIQLTKN